MMRTRELPEAIYRAISNWRLWITLALLAALIINEAVIGIRQGQTITEALTRVSYFKMALLLFVCGVVAQAAIGAVPFVTGATMTMLDFALRRRREWREEGVELGRSEGIELGRSEGVEQGRSEGIELGRSEGKLRAIAAISADPELSDAAKLRAIVAINAAEDDD